MVHAVSGCWFKTGGKHFFLSFNLPPGPPWPSWALLAFPRRSWTLLSSPEFSYWTLWGSPELSWTLLSPPEETCLHPWFPEVPMFVLELPVLPVLRRSPECSGVPMDFADVTLFFSSQPSAPCTSSVATKF